MAHRGEDGATRRAHLEAAARMGSASAKAALVAPRLPAALAHVWCWFYDELHPSRGAGGMGPAPLTWPDLDAWARRMHREPQPWEFRLLRALDGAFFRAVSAK